MPRQYINNAEDRMNARLDPKPSRIPDSIISRNPEQAMHADIELLAGEFVKKEKKMQEIIMHDLHLAQNGTPDQIKEARQQLVKFGVQQSWPIEVLGVVESRFRDTKMQITGPDYQKDPKYQNFHNLFDKSKQEPPVN